jgi:uncharacterized protein YpmS
MSYCVLKTILIAFALIVGIVGLIITFRKSTKEIENNTISSEKGKFDKSGSLEFNFSSGVFLIALSIASIIYIFINVPSCRDEENESHKEDKLTYVEGWVFDENGATISNAQIRVYFKEDSTIFKCGSDGHFKQLLTDTINEVEISVSSLGYQNIVHEITKTNSVANFILTK